MAHTMHCQWGRKPPKLPFPLGFCHPANGGPSHSHRQHAQKNRWWSPMWSVPKLLGPYSLQFFAMLLQVK